MKFAVMFFVGLMTVSGFSQTTDLHKGPSGKMPNTQMSYCNECGKEVERLSLVVKCYKCCTGELDKDLCKDYGNHNYCSKKKKCSCG